MKNETLLHECSRLGGAARLIRRIITIPGNEQNIEVSGAISDCKDKDTCGIKYENKEGYDWSICPLKGRRLSDS